MLNREAEPDSHTMMPYAKYTMAPFIIPAQNINQASQSHTDTTHPGLAQYTLKAGISHSRNGTDHSGNSEVYNLRNLRYGSGNLGHLISGTILRVKVF